jgi:hypothetical protein
MPGFIQSPATLAVDEVAHSLPLGGAGRGFYLTENDLQTFGELN